MRLERTCRRRAAVAVILGPAALFWAVCGPAAAEEKSFPGFAEVEKTVLRYCRTLEDHQPGRIVARSQVEPIFGQLKKIGWEVAEQDAILKRVPGDGDFLVQELSTRKGKRFMDRIANYRGGYDRLERLSRLPRGKQTVRELIRGKDGYKMLEYLATTRGGSELGKMLSKAPAGGGFNKPTGRIYTIEMLLAELKEAHRTAKQATAAGQ